MTFRHHCCVFQIIFCYSNLAATSSVEHLVMCFDAGQKPTEPESLKNRYFLNNSKLNIIHFAFYFGTFWKKCTFNSKNKKTNLVALEVAESLYHNFGLQLINKHVQIFHWILTADDKTLIPFFTWVSATFASITKCSTLAVHHPLTF